MKIGFVGDVHGHVAALERSLRVLRGVGASQIVFLGDSVGYIPTDAAARLVVQEGLPAVTGNHEQMLLTGSTPPDREVMYRHSETRLLLDQAMREAIAGWPQRRLFDDGAVLAIHGSPNDPTWGYVYPDTPLEQFAPEAAIVVMGHTHRPFVRRNGDVLYVNAGSCGLPRDTGGFGSAALVDTQERSARILRFDIRDVSEDVIARCAVHESVVTALRRPIADAFEGTVVNV